MLTRAVINAPGAFACTPVYYISVWSCTTRVSHYIILHKGIN